VVLHDDTTRKHKNSQEKSGPAFAVPILIIVVLVGGSAIFGAVIAMRGSGLAPNTSSSALRTEESQVPAAFLESMHLPEFLLEDQDGNDVGASIFDDHLTILAFTFTNCPTVCPIMNSHLLQLQDRLADSSVQIVSISVDPVNDTPEVLRAHAEHMGIDTTRWHLLTGEAVEPILDGLHLGLKYDEQNQITKRDGGTMANITHPSKLVLVGPDRRILDMSSGLKWDSVAALARRALSMDSTVKSSQ